VPGAGLRARAERKMRGKPKVPESLSTSKMQALIHELHVHQIELEMQNEQLRHAQEEIEAARERYLELYDYAPVGYLTLNPAGVIQAANLTLVAMLGVERSRLLNSPFNRFVFHADQDRFHLCWRKVVDSNDKQIAEIRLRPIGGALFYSRLEAIRASEGGETVCRMTISDITQQKRADETLREAEQYRLRYESDEWKRLALEAGGLGAWDQDLQTGRIICSPHACAMLGFPPEASIDGEAFLSRVHPEDRAALLDALEKSTDPDGSRRCDAVFRITLPDVPTRWLHFMASTNFYPGASGPASRRTGVLADITHQKERENSLKSQAEYLDGLVRERTAKLQDAVSELEYFSYTLAHDLRAPLRAIAGYSALLLKECDGLNSHHRTFLQRSNTAAQRMDNLIMDALDYSKIARGNFKFEPVDCQALLRELIESYPQFHDAAGHIAIEDPLPLVLGSPALLTQCFSNLLTNALKFVAPRQTPAVRIFAQDSDSRVKICFADKGIGISPSDQKILFQLFQRLNHDYEGTGVGLALVKKAAERMGGAVGVSSSPGQGSKFWIELDKAPHRDEPLV
jgi:PAS domain S-box-containing protein